MGFTNNENISKPKNIFRIIIFLVILIVAIILTIKIAPKIILLNNPNNIKDFENYIRSFGVSGWLIFLGIQILQIVVALIPGEPIEILAGAMYGWFYGLVTCMIGIFIGSIIVFYLVKIFGRKLINIFVDESKIRSMPFLNDTKRFETLTFILFFIPGTPKDMLTYVAGLTNIRPIRFFIIATFARIPSILTSTIAGASLIEGQFKITILVFSIAAIISIIGYLVHKSVLKYHNKKR